MPINKCANYSFIFFLYFAKLHALGLTRLQHRVPAPAEAGRALALPRDVVAQPAVATLAVLAAVDAVLAQRARLGTDRALQSKTENMKSWNTHGKNPTAVLTAQRSLARSLARLWS